MRINWKLRLGNKVTLSAIVVAIIALVYQILCIAGVTPQISQSQAVQAAGMLINLLALLGIVTDPTTQGVADSQQALEYTKPKEAENK